LIHLLNFSYKNQKSLGFFLIDFGYFATKKIKILVFPVISIFYFVKFQLRDNRFL